MKTVVSALLVGASLLAAAPASAADYILYSFTAVGTASETIGAGFGTRTGPVLGSFELVLPAEAIGLTTYSTSTFDPDARPTTLTTNANGITFSAKQAPRGSNYLFENITGTVCVPSAGTIGAILGDIGSGCSSFSVNDSGMTGYSYNSTGSITGISTVRFSNSGDQRIGLISIPAIPEPSTWAMMMAGFALAAANLRRRAATRIRHA